MVVGDFILCKKDLMITFNFCDNVYYYKNKSYVIIETCTKYIEETGIFYYVFDTEKGDAIWLSGNKKSNLENIHEYFYTPEEIRLLKLDSI
ncbi:hypothetical protein M0Q50_05330 [bacterium]|jgi:hypothetical protein|nr:hypothetical protein [bacterium]